MIEIVPPGTVQRCCSGSVFAGWPYDYRAQHIPTFDAEVEALQDANIELTAWWFPAVLNDEARLILDVLKRHGVKTQLWVTGGGQPTQSAAEQRQRVRAEADRIRPIAVAAAEIGCSVGLYNHGGWFGEPENQIAVIEELDLPNVGIVYNQHHGHGHVEDFAQLLEDMKPHLLCLNLNGMVAGGDAAGQKIVPLGRGELDLRLLKIIQQSGYTGLIGILNHTQHDAEARLLDNIDGLKWLTRQLDGTPPQPLPALRSPDQPAPEAGNASAAILPYSTQRVVDLLHAAQQRGNAARGAVVFSSPKFACLSCHRIGEHGGQVGPDLAAVLPQRSLVELTESFLWPQRDVPHAWLAWSVVTTDGQQHRGYVERQTARDVLLRDPVSKQDLLLKREDIDDMVRAGSLMPDGLATAMSPQQRADVLRLLMETQRAAGDLSLLSDVSAVLAHAAVHAHAPATFDYASKPLDPAAWPYAGHHVNRERLYDFYRKQALHFRDTHPRPPLLTQYPGLDGGQHGHWGNQNDTIWADGRWNNTDLGNLQCGVLRGHGLTIPRAVCVRLSAGGPVSACFNPDTLQWEAVWTGGFVGFSDVRHGFVGGIQLQGTVAELPVPPDWSEFGLTQATLRDTLRYRGFVRYGAGIALVYRRETRKSWRYSLHVTEDWFARCRQVPPIRCRWPRNGHKSSKQRFSMADNRPGRSIPLNYRGRIHGRRRSSREDMHFCRMVPHWCARCREMSGMSPGFSIRRSALSGGGSLPACTRHWEFTSMNEGSLCWDAIRLRGCTI
jgi:putative heme-binding domain-containing protein